MKLLIDIDDYQLGHCKRHVEEHYANRLEEAIANGTPIPDDATNGDVIKAMFPSIESRLDEKTDIMLVKWADGTAKAFKADWWDAPYERGE